MLDNGRISTKQMAVLVIYFIIGDMLLILPTFTAAAAKQDAWISGWIGFLIGWPITWILFRFSRLFPKLTLFEYNRHLLGRWIGGAVTIFYLYYYLTNVSVLVREIGDFMTTQIFTSTPINAIHLLMIFTLVWGVKSGLETIARTGEIFFPWFLLLFIILFISLIPLAQTIRLQPIWAGGTLPIIHGTLYSSTFSFCELNLFLAILPNVVQNNQTERDYLLGVFIGGMAICCTILLSIMVIGPYWAANQLYTTYAMAKKINIGHFLERIEVILAINWILSSYIKAVLNFYVFLIGMAQLFKLRDYRVLSLPAGMVIFGLAFIVSANFAYFNYIVDYYIFWDITCALVIPFILYSVYLFRKKTLNKLYK